MVTELKHMSENPNIPLPYRTFSRVFSEEASHKFPPSHPWDHMIELKPGTPAALPGKLIPLSQAEQEELHKFVKEHTARGTIRPSKSPYKSRFFYIKKKDGKLQPVQDYRPVNQWTICNAYPLPLIPELIDRLSGCSLYTKFNIWWGYNNIQIKEGDKWKAAFITNEGLFEPTVMFFGLTNSPATFQTMMNLIFAKEIAKKWLTVYMDDMAIHSQWCPEETEEQHIQRHRNYVKRILTKLMKHNLFLKLEKCSFEQPSIKFLGVHITQGQVQMDDTKVDKVCHWRPPTNVTEVRKFLGFTGYYHYFIKDYSKIARPLLQLTHLTTPWTWGESEQTAFETLRKAMIDKPVLWQPDFAKPFFLLTDASAYGVGAILSQEGGSTNPNTNQKLKLHPVAYYSATFMETKHNYDIYKWELLAIMKATTHWRHYLIWTKEPFTILTDHANLLHWKSPHKLNRCTAHWHGELQDYNFKLQHIPGKLHTAADALSRPTGADEGKDDNQQMTMIPEAAFIRLARPDSDGSIEHTITIIQNHNRTLMEEWTGIYPIECIDNPDEPFWRDIKGHWLVIPPDQGLKHKLMNIWHEGTINSHPRRDETIRCINKESFWPGAKMLRSAVTPPIKNFFSSSLAPTRSSSYPFLYDTPKRQSTGMSLNCTTTPYPPSSTCTSLNCNFAQTPHDMPSGLAGALGHLGTHPDDMPSGHLDLTDTLGYRPEDMPSGPPDIHSEHVGHLGHLSYLGLLGQLGYLNDLDPEPIDLPLHAFIEEEEDTQDR
jgi:hypothetical protein